MVKPIVIDKREYYSASDAAKYLGLSRSRISQLCKSGKLKVHYVGATALVPVSDVIMYKSLEGTNNRKPGRKPNDMR